MNLGLEVPALSHHLAYVLGPNWGKAEEVAAPLREGVQDVPIMWRYLQPDQSSLFSRGEIAPDLFSRFIQKRHS